MRFLNLQKTRVVDLRPLGKTSLNLLNLRGTKIRNAQVVALKKKLPNLGVLR